MSIKSHNVMTCYQVILIQEGNVTTSWGEKGKKLLGKVLWKSNNSPGP